MEKNNKGITLVALMVTVIVLLIITTAGISTSLDRFELNDYKKMKSDLELLEDKVSDYYLKYEGLPICRLSDGNIEGFSYTEYINGLTNVNQEPAINANDNDIYYIIDLEALGNITLNYGKDYKEYLGKDDFYVINEQSHTIYYVKGVEMDGVTYHYIKKDEQISDDIPPTAPKINIVSGIKKQGAYINRVKIEIIPGKKRSTNIKATYCTIKNNEEKLINQGINESKIYYLKDSGNYTITAYTEDVNGNQSEKIECTLSINIINYRNNQGEDAQGYILSQVQNIEVWDYLDNKLIVPAGFKIADESKSTQYTIIEDGKENQFVWVAIGYKTIHKNIEEENRYIRKLYRAKFWKGSSLNFCNRNTEYDAKIRILDDIVWYYSEATKDEETSNAHAKNIEEFILNTNSSGGYYIGRYEARTGTERKSSTDQLTPLTLKESDYVYNYVTQSQASKLCQKMYSSDAFTSDLINSFAWDTVFINYSTPDNTYALASPYDFALYDGQANDSEFKKNGKTILKENGNVDVNYGIYDMVGNCKEWTTETYSLSYQQATMRGGKYSGGTDNYAGSRESSSGRCISGYFF